MDLKKLFGYEGKNVVITGATSGMSRSATEYYLSLELMFMQSMSIQLIYLLKKLIKLI